MTSRRGKRQRRWAWRAALMLLLPIAFLAGAPTARAAAATAITVDGASGGRIFDGVGAISGGGGNSRLLSDYPAAQRNEIFDYLFKPGYGASLQILKVEVGGDANSTDGAEPSIEHQRGVVNCNAGYEWSIMAAAKARNPAIKLYALAWTAPGWIGGGSFWSTDMINYYLQWLTCAQNQGFTIDYLGGWNERGYNVGWFENLRAALDANGFSTVQIVGADDVNWNVADSMVADPTFANAVSIVGAHYPCGGDGAPATTCTTTANALATGKPLWASENGSQDMNGGTAALIRAFTRGYIDAKLTAYINWPIVSAMYPGLPWNKVGLMTAQSPWSGSYTVGSSLWAMAQIAQFAQPGWQFLNSSSGYLGGNRANGSFVTLKSTNGVDYSTIIETTTATAPQDVTINVGGSLSAGAVHVWSTNIAAPSNTTSLVHAADITPVGGRYTLTVQPGYVYTVTTTTGQGRGSTTIPATRSLKLPYSDDFESVPTSGEAALLSDMQGAYEGRPCAGGRAGQCVAQVTTVKPIEWERDSDSFALLGDPTWTNYTVQSDVLLSSTGTVELLGRVHAQGQWPQWQAGYYFRVADTGAWSIIKNTTSGTVTTLRSGTRTALGTTSWHTLALSMQGSQIKALIDGTTVATVTDSSYTAGVAGIGLQGYKAYQFDNLKVFGSVRTGPITSGFAGYCMDDKGNSSASGTPVELWSCTGGAAQKWNVYADGTIQIHNMCVDVRNAAKTNGSLVQLAACNGTASQQWNPSTGTLINGGSLLCLDDPMSSATNGTQLQIWACNGGKNQQWTLP